jgi:hypothetical protein
MDAVETLRERIPNIRTVIPPTVLQELTLAVKSAGSERKGKAAFLALSRSREWGFEPLNLVPVGHGIVERIADALRHERLIPSGEKNDSLVVAEAALLGCGILLEYGRAHAGD